MKNITSVEKILIVSLYIFNTGVRIIGYYAQSNYQDFGDVYFFKKKNDV